MVNIALGGSLTSDLNAVFTACTCAVFNVWGTVAQVHFLPSFPPIFYLFSILFPFPSFATTHSLKSGVYRPHENVQIDRLLWARAVLGCLGGIAPKFLRLYDQPIPRIPVLTSYTNDQAPKLSPRTARRCGLVLWHCGIKLNFTLHHFSL